MNYCTKCGNKLNENDIVCQECGYPIGVSQQTKKESKFSRFKFAMKDLSNNPGIAIKKIAWIEFITGVVCIAVIALLWLAEVVEVMFYDSFFASLIAIFITVIIVALLIFIVWSVYMFSKGYGELVFNSNKIVELLEKSNIINSENKEKIDNEMQ